jgi:DNA sulfur modification protein DndC
MLPLLELRNALDVPDDRHLRDFRRMSGLVQIFHDKPIPGPYKQGSREQWLTKVLQAQKWIRTHGPEYVRGIELISLPELHEIRRIWVVEKHEIEDTLPRIYEEVMGELFPAGPLDDNLALGREEMTILRWICQDNDLLYELTRELLDVERRYRTAKRSGLFEALEDAVGRSFYADEADATRRAMRLRDAREHAKEGAYEQLSLGESGASDDAMPVVTAD